MLKRNKWPNQVISWLLVAVLLSSFVLLTSSASLSVPSAFNYGIISLHLFSQAKFFRERFNNFVIST